MGFVAEFRVRIEGWGNPRTVYAHSDGREVTLEVKICECKRCDERESAIRKALERKEGLRWRFERFWIHGVTIADTGIKAGETLESQFQESLKGVTQHPVRGEFDGREFERRVVEYLAETLELNMELAA